MGSTILRFPRGEDRQRQLSFGAGSLVRKSLQGGEGRKVTPQLESIKLLGVS